MSAAVAAVTLRELMTMSGGFPGIDPEYATVKRMFASRTRDNS
jgi:CubicO group peptidase (beta-lactamase class C family)